MNKGFTLIELLVAIAIIGVLASLTLSNFNGAQIRARDAQRKNDLKVVRDALEQYKIDRASYPSIGTSYVANATTAFNVTSGNTQFTNLMGDTSAGLVTLGYMKKAPVDPRASAGTTYQYRYALTDNTASSYFLEACLENNQDSSGYASGSRLAPCNTGSLTNYRVTNP